MKFLIIGDPHGKLPKRIPKNVDLILVTGDLGKTDLIRAQAFKDVERKKKGLPKQERGKQFTKKFTDETYNSTMKVVNTYSKIAPTYTLIGNVGTSDGWIEKDEKRLRIKLPYLKRDLRNSKKINVVKNRVRNINGLRIGFLDYFVDTAWIKEFKEKRKKKLKVAEKETAKAKRVLKGWDNVDILLTHIPPYGVLDKVTWKNAPKHYQGKHAGSKVVLDYIKKKQPRYVFCGHIHEGKGKKKIGKTIVINAGVSGDYVLLDII